MQLDFTDFFLSNMKFNNQKIVLAVARQ